MSSHTAETAKIGDNTKLGRNVIIEDNVIIGEDCLIGNNVVILEGSKIGQGVRIDEGTVVGKKSLSSPRSIFKVDPNLMPAVIGNMCQIGANVVIYVQCEIGNNNLIADSATIRENVKIGDLNIVGRNVTIENYINIGDRNKFETNCYVTAYSEVGNYCFVAPCVATSNDNYIARDKERYNNFKGVTIKDGGRIGVGAVILPGKIINEDSVAAAGSVVTKDIPKGEIWAGNPAKFFRKVPEEQLLKNNLDKK
jgi:UDP-2-acetamido-3-amino-2,3-dideoxy-glucuronate N-acetyltransferase